MKTFLAYQIYKDNIESELFLYIFKTVDSTIRLNTNVVKIINNIAFNSVTYNYKMGFKNNRLCGPYNKYNIKLYKFKAIELCKNSIKLNDNRNNLIWYIITKTLITQLKIH